MEHEELKALIEAKFDAMTKSHQELHAKQEKTEIQVFELKSDVQLMISEVRRLSKILEDGNGMRTRITKLETLQINAIQRQVECQKRSAARWKFLIGAFTTLAVGTILFLLTKGG